MDKALIKDVLIDVWGKTKFVIFYMTDGFLTWLSFTFLQNYVISPVNHTGSLFYRILAYAIVWPALLWFFHALLYKSTWTPFGKFSKGIAAGIAIITYLGLFFTLGLFTITFYNPFESISSLFNR